MTAAQPGAIAILQLFGDVRSILASLSGKPDWPVGRMRLVKFREIDEGLAGRIAEDVAQLMPHGGIRVVQRMCELLVELGAKPLERDDADPRMLYPEAADAFEALMLSALARATSPLAIDPLLAQPAVWRSGIPMTDEDEARSQRLNQLISPPVVVLAGPPNVGKSTLSNALLGRSVSIASDLAGTTRDYVAARLELGGLVVDWHDTPGLRVSDDPIETKAIELARAVQMSADLLIAITDTAHDWPDLPRVPDVRVASRSDLGSRNDAELSVSAIRGTGLRELGGVIREKLVSQQDIEAAHSRPWFFDRRLLTARLSPSC